MGDEERTKTELIDELQALRQRVARLEEAEMAREQGLTKRRERYRVIFDSMIERIWYVDRKGTVLYVNSIGARDLGLPVESVIGRSLHDLFPMATASRLYTDNMDVINSGRPKLGLSEEYPLGDGMKGCFQTDKIPYYDGNGEVTGVLVFAVDFTAHMRAEEALSTSQLQLSEAMDLARIVYWQLDPDTDTFIFNDPFYSFYGTTAEREGGYLMTRVQYARRFMHPDDMHLFRQASEKRMSYKGLEYFNEFEHRIIRRDGRERHVLARIRATMEPTGRVTKCYGANQDITERKKAEERLERERLLKETQLRRGKALEQSREELRNLSEHLQRVRERERTRIARKVHDELGQFLSALKIDLTCLGQGLNKNQGDILEQIEGMATKIDAAVHTVRKICSELRPSILDDFGLCAAIEWHAEDFQKRTGIRFVTRIDPAVSKVEKRLALVLFRIFQESVTNVLRHAEATTVKVSFKSKADNLVLKVADNGKGISKRQLSSPGSLGIIGMRERVRFWNGQLLFRSVRNRGTTMIVSIPLTSGDHEIGEMGYPPDLSQTRDVGNV
jgi:PAS domain S-box-containing protein